MRDNRKNMTIEMPRHAREIIEALNEHGYEAYIVGGCVRDSMIGKKPGDWDITTSARPEQVKQVFGRTIDTGIQHGTVTIMRGKVGYEVTTYRIDGEYEDGRHPKSVSFTPSLEEDLKRRDFTINAMAYSPKDGLVDLFDGVKDLEDGVIRCVGVAEERFSEDALRILRALRFSAQLGFTIEEETRKALCELAPNLAHVSKERIQVELTKLLASDHPDYMKKVFEYGLSSYITETFSDLREETIRVDPKLPADKAVRWAACLLNLAPEKAARILKELKLDNATIARVRTLVSWFPVSLGCQKPDLRRVVSQIGWEAFEELLMLKESGAGDGKCPEDSEQLGRVRLLAKEIYEDGDCVSLKDLAVTGTDLIKAGVKPGPKLGEILASMLQLVLEEPDKNEKETLLHFAGF